MKELLIMHQRNTQRFVDYFLMLVTNSPKDLFSIGRDFGNVRNALDLALEDKQESTLTVPVQKAILSLRYYFEQNGLFKIAIAYTEQAIEVAQLQDDNYHLGHLLATLAIYEGSCGQFERAVSLLERSMQVATQQNDRELECRCAQNLGSAYLLMSKMTLSRQYTERALELSRQLEHLEQTLSLLPNLAYIALLQANYAQALTLLKEAHQKRASNDDPYYSGIDINLGLALGRTHDTEQAQKTLIHIRDTSIKSGFTTDVLICSNELAEIALFNADLEAARYNLDIAREYEKDVTLADYVGMTYCLLGILCQYEGKQSEATTHWENARSIAKSQDNTHVLSAVSLAEGQFYMSLMQIEKAAALLLDALALAEEAMLHELEGRAAIELSKLPGFDQRDAMRERAKAIFNQPSIFRDRLI